MPLQSTETGLPAVPVASSSGPAPQWPNGIQWDAVEMFVPSEGVAYMVRQECTEVEAPKKLFYPKKLDPSVINKLSAHRGDAPKVKFVYGYGDDYGAVKNLPKRRVRRNTKKKVKSWAAKATVALAALVMVCAEPRKLLPPIWPLLLWIRLAFWNCLRVRPT